MFLYFILHLFNIYKATDIGYNIIQELNLKNHFIYNQSNMDNSEFIFIIFSDKITMFTLKDRNNLLINTDISQAKKISLINNIILNLYNLCKNSNKNIYVMMDDIKSSNKIFSNNIIQIVRKLELLGLHHLLRLGYDRLETTIENIIISCCLFNILELGKKMNFDYVVDQENFKYCNSTRKKCKFYDILKRQSNVAKFQNIIKKISSEDSFNNFFGKFKTYNDYYEGLEYIIDSKSQSDHLDRKEFIEIFYNLKFHESSVNVIRYRKLNNIKFIVNNDVFFKFLLEKININFSLISFNNENLLNMVYTKQNENVFVQMNIEFYENDLSYDYQTKIINKILKCDIYEIVDREDNLILDSNQFDICKYFKKIYSKIIQTCDDSTSENEFKEFIKFLSSVKENELELFCFFYFINNNIFEQNFVLKIIKSNTILSNFFLIMVLRANIFDPYDLNGYDYFLKDFKILSNIYALNYPKNLGEKLRYLKGTNVYKYFMCFIYFKVNYDPTEKHLFLTNIKTITETNDNLRDACRNIFDYFKFFIRNRNKIIFIYRNSIKLLDKIHKNLISYDIMKRSRYDIRTNNKFEVQKYGDVNIKYNQKIMIFN